MRGSNAARTLELFVYKGERDGIVFRDRVADWCDPPELTLVSYDSRCMDGVHHSFRGQFVGDVVEGNVVE